MNKEILELWLDLRLELKAFILNKVRDEVASEDILQDVFLKVHEHVHTLKDPLKLTSWIYQITRNLIVDYFRGLRKPAAEVVFLNLAEEEADEPLYSNLANCVNLKVERLSEKYKSAILLTTFQEYTQKELSEYLGISYSGAKARVQRARDMLKASLVNCKNVETDARGNILNFKNS